MLEILNKERQKAYVRIHGSKGKDISIKQLRKLYLQADRALQAIEAASYCIDNGIGDYENAERKNLEKFAHEAYLISHSMQPNTICYDSHEDWRKQVDEILKAADKAGIAKYENPLKRQKKGG